MNELSDAAIIRIFNDLPSSNVFPNILLVSKRFHQLSYFTRQRPTLQLPIGPNQTIMNAKEVAKILKYEFESNGTTEISDLCEKFPNKSHANRSHIWYYFMVQIGEEIFNEKLDEQLELKKRTMKAICDSLFHRTWNIIAQLRRRKSYNQLLTKMNKKGDIVCLLQARTMPDPVNSPLIRLPTPMPVEIAPLEDLQPFFNLIMTGEGMTKEFADAQNKRIQIQANNNDITMISLKKGTIFADGRMDMCKQVVGPDHIGPLCEAVGQAKCFQEDGNDITMISLKKGTIFADGRMDMCKQVVGPDHIGPLCEAVGQAKCFQEDDNDIPMISLKKGTIFADGRMDMCKQVVGPDHIGPLCEAVGQAKCFQEDDHDIPMISLQKGTIFADGRMDMCKQVVGPTHIGPLCEAVGQAKCFSSIQQAPLIRHFLLGNNVACQDKPEAAIHLANLIRLNRPIETFYLAGNCLTELSIGMITEALEFNTHVKALWLKRNPVGPEGAKKLGHYLASKSCTLRVLDLQNCALGDEGIDRFCEAIENRLEKEERNGNELSLKHLYIDANGITGQSTAFQRFCRLLTGPLRGLKTLYISINALGDQGILEISNALPFLSKLRFLSLGSNQITDDSILILFSSLSQCKNLKGLDLGCYKSTKDMGGISNFITEASIPLIWSWIYDHDLCEYIDIRNNAFKDQESLVEFVENLNQVMIDSGRKFTLQATQSNWVPNVNRKLMFSTHMNKQEVRMIRHTKRVVHIDSIYRNKM